MREHYNANGIGLRNASTLGQSSLHCGFVELTVLSESFVNDAFPITSLARSIFVDGDYLHPGQPKQEEL